MQSNKFIRRIEGVLRGAKSSRQERKGMSERRGEWAVNRQRSSPDMKLIHYNQILFKMATCARVLAGGGK